MQGWQDNAGGASQDDAIFAEAQRLALGRVFNNSQGSQPNQQPGSSNAPPSNTTFSPYAYGGGAQSQSQGNNQQTYGSTNQGTRNDFGDFAEPTTKRQRQYAEPDQGGQYQDQRNGSVFGGAAPRPTSSDVYVFSRPGGAQQQQQQSQQPQHQQQGMQRQQQQTQQQQQQSNALQTLLSNMGGGNGGNGGGLTPQAIAMAQLITLASQNNSSFRQEMQQLPGMQQQRSAANDLQMRLLQSNMQNNRRLEGIHGTAGAGRLPNFGAFNAGGGGGIGGGLNALGSSSLMNMLHQHQQGGHQHQLQQQGGLLQQQQQQGVPLPQPIAPLPMMGDLLQMRQQAVEAAQEVAAPEPEPEEDKEEDILDKVGKISEKLRSMLGRDVGDR